MKKQLLFLFSLLCLIMPSSSLFSQEDVNVGEYVSGKMGEGNKLIFKGVDLSTDCI